MKSDSTPAINHRARRGLPGAPPNCYLDESAVAVQAAAALVSPGLTQLNVRIPDNAAVGDQHFFCTYANRATLSALSALIAVQ